MLNTIERMMPELYQTAWNMYGGPSYTMINGEKVDVERGVYQGCPLAGTGFCVAIGPLIDELNENLSQGMCLFFMDDGYYAGSIKEAEAIWKRIQLAGPKYGFRVNAKSKIFVKRDLQQQDTRLVLILGQRSENYGKQGGQSNC